MAQNENTPHPIDLNDIAADAGLTVAEVLDAADKVCTFSNSIPPASTISIEKLTDSIARYPPGKRAAVKHFLAAQIDPGTAPMGVCAMINETEEE